MRSTTPASSASTACRYGSRPDAQLSSMPLYSTDREILETAIDWLETGHRSALVTVVRTWGSSPRPVGSLLLIREDGAFNGSISGGCVEEDLVARYRDGQLTEVFPIRIAYGINPEEAARFGLPCGDGLNCWSNDSTARSRCGCCWTVSGQTHRSPVVCV